MKTEPTKEQAEKLTSYRNGRKINVGEVAIGCWRQSNSFKMCATVVILKIVEGSAPIVFAYLNGKDNNISTHNCAGYELMLIEDIFTGDIHPS